MKVTLTKVSAWSHQLYVDGAFRANVTRQTRRTTGLHSERVTSFACRLDGVEISASTLSGLRAKIASGVSKP